MANPLRGEVWLIDLGMVAKIRPCLIFSVPAAGPNAGEVDPICWTVGGPV